MVWGYEEPWDSYKGTVKKPFKTVHAISIQMASSWKKKKVRKRHRCGLGSAVSLQISKTWLGQSANVPVIRTNRAEGLGQGTQCHLCSSVWLCCRSQLTFNNQRHGGCHIIVDSVLIVCKSTRVITFVIRSQVMDKQMRRVYRVPWSLKSFTVLQQQKNPLTVGSFFFCIYFNWYLQPSQMSWYLKPLKRCGPIVGVHVGTIYSGIFFWYSDCSVLHIIWNVAICGPFIDGDIHIASHIPAGTIKIS